MSLVPPLKRNRETHVKMKTQWRGLNLKITYLITRMECGDTVNMLPLSIRDLAWVQLMFILNVKKKCCLQPYISFKKHSKAEESIVEIKVSCGKFVKQSICANDWNDHMILGPAIETNKNNTNCKSKIIHTLLQDVEIIITVKDITPKPAQFLKSLCEDSTFTDFTLKAEDGSVAVHRAVLGMHSDVFLTMLNGEWKETVEGTISLKGVTRETLQHLKNYMYLSSLPEEQLQIQQLLLIAVCYMVANLKTDCIEKLVALVTPENFNALVEFACQHNVPDLMKAIFTETPDNLVNGIIEKKMMVEQASIKNLEKLWNKTP